VPTAAAARIPLHLIGLDDQQWAVPATAPHQQWVDWATTLTTITVGGVSDQWSVQTTTDGCAAGSPAVGTVCADGTVYAGLSPDGNVKMYTTPAEDGMSTLGWDNGYTGRANSEAQALVGGYHPGPACTELVAHAKSDW
jgi:hypothetical protein